MNDLTDKEQRAVRTDDERLLDVGGARDLSDVTATGGRDRKSVV